MVNAGACCLRQCQSGNAIESLMCFALMTGWLHHLDQQHWQGQLPRWNPPTKLDPNAWWTRLLPAQCCSGQLATKSCFSVKLETLTAMCRLQAQASQLLAARWVQCCYALPSSLPNFAHLTVRSIELACCTSGSSAGTAVPLLAYLGESSPPQALQLMPGTTWKSWVSAACTCFS